MDFELGTVAEGNIDALAIEINKAVLKEDGSYLVTNVQHEVAVKVFYKEMASGEEDNFAGIATDQSIDADTLAGLTNGYTQLHSKPVQVGAGGFGSTYDYDVDRGLLYIQEDENSIDKYLTGTDGKKYQYVNTRMETAYVWRTDGDEGKVHHADGMTSIPEVLGRYAYGDNTNLDNKFLEFFIYNIYKEIETVDVPVDKSWPDDIENVQNADEYTWSATFVLEEKEVHESGPISPEANTTVFRKVDGVNPLTISKGDSGDSITFKNLPKYRYYEVDGEQSVYRLIYSVDEIAYELKQNGTTVNKWDKNKGLTIGNDVYAPYWLHDAGDAGDQMGLSADDTEFYHIIIKNDKNDVTIKHLLTDLRINKQWENGALAEAGVSEKDAYAKFQLKRYMTTEHLSYDMSYYDGSDVTVTLIGQDGNTDYLTVKKGARVKIAATFNGTGAVGYSVDDTNNKLELSWYSGNNIITSGEITASNNLTIRPANENWQNGQVSEDHLVLAASGGSEAAEDTVFTDEGHFYTLNREGGWTQIIDNLPLYAESAVTDGEQNIYHYSYYFTEVDSNPSGFYSEFTDKKGNPIGDANHRITGDNTTVVALNKKVPPLYVKKEWYDIEDPDSYPEIRFTLYQGLKNGDGVLEGQVFVGENGESYVDIPLNADNHWTWKCPGYLPTKNANGQEVGYYVVENTGTDNNHRQALIYNNSELNADGSIKVPGTEITTSAAEKDEIWIWSYYNDKNDYNAFRTDQGMPRGWEGGFAGNTGTLTIVNRAPKYIQFDIKKKWLYLTDKGELQTTTGDPSTQNHIYIKLELMRKTVAIDGTYTETQDTDTVVDWESYGLPFVVGYDDPQHPRFVDPNDYGIRYDSAWFWWVSDEYQSSRGLPLYGYVESDNGSHIPVKYYYITRELGVFSDIECMTPWNSDYTWYGELLPQAWGETRPIVFDRIVAQDQDRLVNIQGSDLEVQKDWLYTPDNVEEVYVKIWMQSPADSNPIDFTSFIADKTTAFSSVDAGFVSDKTRLQMLDNGVLVLGLTRESSLVLIDGLPVLNTNGSAYKYWVEEVGYKDSDGNIYLNSTSPDSTSTFFPQYDQNNEEWKDDPADNKIQLGKKGQNKLRIKNQPTKDIEVTKEWYDENGNKLTGPWKKAADGTTPVATSISFKVKRGDGQYLTFNDSDTLTIQPSGKRAVVRTAEKDGTAYTVTYVDDSEDRADIGNWITLIHGLQKYASDGTEYTYTIEELKNANGKPVDSSGAVIENCHVSVTGNGAAFVIRNEKISTSLAIQKTFAGAVELTDAQKQKITFKVTGKFEGTTEETRTFTYGLDGITVGSEQLQQDVYKWNDGVLIIKGIQPGDYTVIEEYDDVRTIFADDTSGKTYTHTSTFAVGTTETTGPAKAVVSEGECADVFITNTYDYSLSSVDIQIVKIDETTRGQDTPTKLQGAEFQLFKYTVPEGSSDGSYTVYPESGNDKKTDTNGTLSFEDLPDGQYKITEKKPPDGYLKVENNDIYFDVIQGEVTRYKNEYSGSARNPDDAITGEANMITYESDNDHHSFIVGNTPGAELPRTGGPGTALFALIGGLLVGTAGAALILFRKKNRG